MLMMAQYISCPLPFRKPPAIFCLFFAFRRSLSEMLSSKGTEKSTFRVEKLLRNQQKIQHFYSNFFC